MLTFDRLQTGCVAFISNMCGPARGSFVDGGQTLDAKRSRYGDGAVGLAGAALHGCRWAGRHYVKVKCRI